MSKPGSTPTRPMMAASLTSRRLPNLPRLKRMVSRTPSHTMTSSRKAATATLMPTSQPKFCS